MSRVATFSDFRGKLSFDEKRHRGAQQGGNAVTISRRNMLSAALAAPALIGSARMGSLAAAQTLKISHQFPGGTIGAVTAQVYPNSSLMKTVAQFSAVRKGALDLSLYPISYAGGEYAELNIGLMPGVVSSYAQGAAWKTSAVG